MRKIITLIIATITGLTLLMSLSVASAQTITINEHVLDGSKKSACATTAITATVDTTNHLTLNNINPTCYGLNLSTDIISSNSTTPTIYTATPTATSITFPSTITTPSAVTKARTFINGWSIPTTWSYTAPVVPPTGPITTNPTTPGVTTTTVYTQPSGSQFCANITVSTTSTTPINWKADLNITGVPFNGDTNLSHYQIQQSYYYGFESQTPVNGKFTLISLQPSSQKVSNTQTQFITVCNYTTPPPTINPNLTYTQTQTTPTASYYVCKNVTVSVAGSPQFYVGWQATVDVTDLKNLYIPGTGGQVQGPSGGYVRTNTATPNIYTITGNGYNTQAIKDGTPVTFTICWG